MEILHNPVYLGALVYGKTGKRRPGGKLQRIRPEKWVILPNHHEPIITPNIWKTAQEILRRRYDKTPLSNVDSQCRDTPYPLKDNIYCGHHGKELRFDKKKKGDRLLYCPARYCINHNISLNNIVQSINKLLVDNVSKITKGNFRNELISRCKAKTRKLLTELSKIEKQIESQTKYRESEWLKCEQKQMTPVQFEQENMEINQRLQSLQKKRDALSCKLNTCDYWINNSEAWLNRIAKFDKNIEKRPYEEQTKLFNSIVAKGLIYERKNISITLK